MTENTAPLESGAAGRGGRPGAAQLHVITEDDLKSEFPGPLGPWKFTYSNYPEWLSSSVEPAP